MARHRRNPNIRTRITYDLRGLGKTFALVANRDDPIPENVDWAAEGKIIRAAYPEVGQTARRVVRLEKDNEHPQNEKCGDDQTYLIEEDSQFSDTIWPLWLEQIWLEKQDLVEEHLVAPDGRYLKSFRTNEPLRIIDGRPIPNIIGSVERGWYLAMLMGLGYVPRDLVSRILITLDRTTKRLDSALGQQARRFREDHGGIDLNTTEHGAVVKYIAAMFWNEDGTVKATDEQLRRNTMAKLSDDGTRRWHKNTWILAPPSVEPTGDKLKVINQCLRKYPLPRPTVRTPMIEKEDVEDEEVWQKAKDKIVSQVFKDVDFTDPAQLAERKAGTLTTKPKHKRRIQKIAAEDDDNEDEEGSPKMEKRYPTRDRKRSSRALAIEEDASESSNSEQEPSEKEEVEEPLEQVVPTTRRRKPHGGRLVTNVEIAAVVAARGLATATSAESSDDDDIAQPLRSRKRARDAADNDRDAGEQAPPRLSKRGRVAAASLEPSTGFSKQSVDEAFVEQAAIDKRITKKARARRAEANRAAKERRQLEEQKQHDVVKARKAKALRRLRKEEVNQGRRFEGSELAEQLYEHERSLYREEVAAASAAQAKVDSGNAPTAWLPVPSEGVPETVGGQALRVEEHPASKAKLVALYRSTNTGGWKYVITETDFWHFPAVPSDFDREYEEIYQTLDAKERRRVANHPRYWA